MFGIIAAKIGAAINRETATTATALFASYSSSAMQVARSLTQELRR
jgi:hypothetical protein